MNKRARMRLIGVTAIIVIVIAVLVITLGNKTAAQFSTVSEVAKGATKSGERVKIGGAVVAGSWNKQSSPMKFTIKEENDTAGTGPTIAVVYSGAAPNTFGDGVVAIVTGTLDDKGVVQANEMITKCPSKYSSAVGAIPVGELGKGQSQVGKKDLQVSGYVKPTSLSSDPAKRFALAAKADGTGDTVVVKFSGAMPDTIKDGVQVVVTGTLGADNILTATSVALAQGQ